MNKPTLAQIPAEYLPKHIGIIMDGNGRWATSRKLPRTAGHKKGAEVFRKISDHCYEMGISYVTFYTFSTENWKRPQEEIDEIMNLLRSYLEEGFSYSGRKQKDEVRLRFLGDLAPLALDIREKIAKLERDSAKENAKITINIALNYGGRHEIVSAVRSIAQACAKGDFLAETISEQMISDRLYTAGQPDPDLIIRPSGEQRISNFLLWQSAYAELVFMNVLWPDFTAKHLDEAIVQYVGRTRRFGGV